MAAVHQAIGRAAVVGLIQHPHQKLALTDNNLPQSAVRIPEKVWPAKSANCAYLVLLSVQKTKTSVEQQHD